MHRLFARVKSARSLRVLAALLCLPMVLLVGAAGNAAAASNESVTIKMDRGMDFDFHCGWAHGVTGTSVETMGTGWCSTRAVPNGTCEAPTPECSTLTLIYKGVDSGGNQCERHIEPSTTNASSTFTAKVNFTATLDLIDCDPLEVCAQIDYHGFGRDDSHIGCQNSALDLENVVDQCDVIYDVEVAVGGVAQEYATSSTDQWKQELSITYSSTVAAVGYVVMEGPWVTNNTTLSPLRSPTFATRILLPSTGGVSSTVTWKENVSDRFARTAVPEPGAVPIGMGIFRDNGTSAVNTMKVPAPDGSGTGRVGLTNPVSTVCASYWGEPLWKHTDPLNPTDVPVGPLDGPEGPVEVPEPEPEPEPIDESGFWDGVVGLLRALLNAIKALATAIANAIARIFIPRDGFFEDELDKVKDSAQDTTLGNYWTAVGDALVVPSTSGCQGPLIQMSPLGGEGSYPLSACDGAMATLASTSRLVLSVGFGLFGALACVRVLGRSFGWEMGVGEGKAP